MEITFVLPRSGTRPVGGIKVVYEYANTLVERGHRVNVVHPAMLFALKNTTKLRFLRKSWLRFLKGKIRGDWTPKDWFSVDSRVNMLWVPNLAERHIPAADVIVATQWATAEEVALYSEKKGKKYYLIQHYEYWDVSEERLISTWKLPLKKLVIAAWLQDIAAKLSEQSFYLPNGLDEKRFYCVDSIEGRNPLSVAMLCHGSDWKGTKDGIAAIEIAKEKFPQLKVDLFGVGQRPDYVPAWISYHQNPQQDQLRQLYNSAAIFVAPSWSEGWGLPPSEAMMCGAAVVGTHIGGHLEFMQHEKTALLSPPKEPALLAENLIRLLENNALRCELAVAGNENIKRFTWKNATDRLEKAFSEF